MRTGRRFPPAHGIHFATTDLGLLVSAVRRALPNAWCLSGLDIGWENSDSVLGLEHSVAVSAFLFC